MKRVMLRRKRSKCSAQKSMHELWSDVMELVGEMEVIEAVSSTGSVKISWRQIDQAKRSYPFNESMTNT